MRRPYCNERRAASWPAPAAFALALALALPQPSAQPKRSAESAAMQRQAERIQRLVEDQRRLQAENEALQRDKARLETDLKRASDSGATRLRTVQRRSDMLVRELQTDLNMRDRDLAALRAQLEDSRRESQHELQRAREDARARDAAAQAELARQRDALAELRSVVASRDRSIAEANARDAALVTLIGQCRDQNHTLAALSKELLEAIDRGGMGQALVAGELFSGSKRVRIETAIQDYRDRIDDARTGSRVR